MSSPRTEIENNLENTFFVRNIKMLGVIVIKSPDVEEITTMMFLLRGRVAGIMRLNRKHNLLLECSFGQL